MAQVKINRQAFLRKVETTISPSLRRGLARVATKKASWGIKDDELALVMGVLNFGDPDHRFPNTPNGVLAPIPKRPWLERSTEGYYQTQINKYVNENLGRLVAGLPKRGRGQGKTTARAISAEDFAAGLAKIGAENARKSYEIANFEPNSPATLAHKQGTKPLHDTGRMNAGKIVGWVE